MLLFSIAKKFPGRFYRIFYAKIEIFLYFCRVRKLQLLYCAVTQHGSYARNKNNNKLQPRHSKIHSTQLRTRRRRHLKQQYASVKHLSRSSTKYTIP